MPLAPCNTIGLYWGARHEAIWRETAKASSLEAPTTKLSNVNLSRGFSDGRGALLSPSTGKGAAESVDVTELESLRFCLGEMKEDDRNYVLLAYYEGYSREELAERFDAPVGTIKTRLRRGLIALRTCLEAA